jgi:drug/metabolite transporter (DMT)-like permease
VIAAALVVTGVGVLELGGAGASGGLAIGKGDAVCMLSPLFWGTGWFALSLTMERYPQDAAASTAVQLLAVAFVFGIFAVVALIYEGGSLVAIMQPLFFDTTFLQNLFLAAILGNALSMFLCSLALKRLPPKIVSVIVASEPIWSAMSAAVVLGDSFKVQDYVGGAFMIAGVVCNELFLAGEHQPPEDANTPKTPAERTERLGSCVSASCSPHVRLLTRAGRSRGESMTSV